MMSARKKSLALDQIATVSSKFFLSFKQKPAIE